MINIAEKNEYSTSIPQNEYSEGVSGQYIKIKKPSPFEDIKARLSKIIEALTDTKETTFDDEIQQKFLDLDFGGEFDIDASKIGIEDAAFFINILNQNNIINYSTEDNKLTININDKTINATNALLNMLKISHDTKKPIRLDFENDITVILKLDKDGKIQTHFIPGTLEAQNYLKNNLMCLKQAFDDENINYSYIGYSKSKEENRKKDKRSNR